MCLTATGQEIAILALAPYASELEELDWKAGPALIPAVRLAVDRINNRTDLLPGYDVQLLEGKSGCQQDSESTFSFVSHIFHSATSTNVVGVIGPACSGSAIFVGKLGARDSISLIQISPTATSPLLTDTDKYLNTFRMLSPSQSHVAAVTELVRYTKWENIALLHNNLYSHLNVLADEVVNNFPSKVGFISEIYYPLECIAERFKVIVLLAGTKHSREVLCLAYHRHPQVIYPIYQWIVVDNLNLLSSVQFTYRERFYNCTRDMMARAIEGLIFTSYPLHDAREDKQETTDVDLTVEQYQHLYRGYRDKHVEELAKLQREVDYNAEEYSVSYYDATWALVLALNASLDKLSLSSLTEYGYGQPKTTRIIRQQLSQLVFEGMMSFRQIITPNHFLELANSPIGIFRGDELQVFENRAKFVEDSFYRKFVRVI
jgi:gamma-aminobutyric acid type B receptor